MSRVNSFPAVAASTATRLVLGSMPGRVSLESRQYYAHSRNAFWPIMAEVFGFSPALSYADRCAELLRHEIALWDVLHACERTGSLDSAIVTQSMVANDFMGFYQQHRHIRAIYFNGAMAEKAYRTQVKELLPPALVGLPAIRLPSTSPAHAAISYQDKLAQWRVVAAG